MPVAIVGDGLAGFVGYVTLRHGGLSPDEIAVFGDDPDPAAAWRVRAAAIRQRRMRSESNGHVGATSFPGLAVRAAARRPWSLVETVLDRYHPTVDEFLAHVERVRRASGWDESFRARRVQRVAPVAGGFELDGEGFEHVLLAPGHPGLNVPDELAGDGRVVHAYEPHDYAGEVCVVGAGMAAATEWLNALAAGSARVVSVRRREPARRPLNVERQYFTKRGLAGFRRTAPAERVELLRGFLEPSYPPGRAWDAPLEDPRFRVEARVNGAEQVIAATGFRHGFAHDPLLARLVEESGLETAASWIVLDADSTVPRLSDRTRTLALAGAPAQWSFPAADTLVGMKVAARGFLRRVKACRRR